MIRYAPVACCLALLLEPTCAQGPTFVLKHPPLVRIAADNVPALLEQWPKSRLARLCAHEDVRHAVRSIVDYTANHVARRQAITDAVQRLERSEDLDPWQVAALYRLTDLELWRLLQHHADETRSVELLMAADPDQGMSGSPITLRTMSCLPHVEGRRTRQFDEEARRRAASRFFKADLTASIGGLPAYVFDLPDELKQGKISTNLPKSNWMLHLPGRYLYGIGDAEQMGAVGPAPERDRAEISLEMDLAAFTDGWQVAGRGVPGDFEALGFSGLKSLRWSGRFVGEDICDQVRVELADEPKGLVGALLTGTAELPPQPLPKGAMLQLRAAADLDLLVAFVQFVAGDQVPAMVLDTARAAFDGGLAIACCAPAPGGLIPRIYLSAGIADDDKLQQLVGMLLAQKFETRRVTYGDTEVTTLKIPGAPQGLQLAWCRVGDTLHVAESALSLRSLLKAIRGGGVAMDVGEATPPAVGGQALDTFDLRFDAAAAYEAFHTHWLPLYELSAAAGLPSPVTRDDLPDPDVVAEFLPPTRAVLSRDGDVFTLTQSGTFGGFETAALLMTWGPILCTQMSSYLVERFSEMVAAEKLTRVYEAFAAFRKREQRWPHDLAELFRRERLADDALLLPMDGLAEPVLVGDGRQVRSSFRYFGGKLQFGGVGPDDRVLLVEIRPHQRDRPILMIDGTVPNVYGIDSRKPIDRFGR